MRIFLFLIFILLLSGCNTVEVAREVTKATKSIKNSVDKIIKNDEKKEEVSDNFKKSNDIINSVVKEKKILEKEKKREKKLIKEQKKIIKEQKKITKVNFLGKTINEVKSNLGEPNLKRHDGNTQTIRFDTKICRLFIFLNLSVNTPRVEHFEIRDIKGNIIHTKEKIQKCYTGLDLT